MIDIFDKNFEELMECDPRLERWLRSRNGDKPKRNGLKFRSEDKREGKGSKTQMSDEDIYKPIFRNESRSLSIVKAESMIKNWDFYDNSLNPQGRGFKISYSSHSIGGAKIVVDRACGLIWQKGGSSNCLRFDEANEWIKNLNERGFAVLDGWRLPTLEEAMSLIKSEEKRGGLHVDPAFNKMQEWIWTADNSSESSIALVWVVDFLGSCYGVVKEDGLAYVRAVCSVPPVKG